MSKALHISRVNPAAVTVLGGDESEILSRSFFEFVTPALSAQPDRDRETWKLAIEGGREVTGRRVELQRGASRLGRGLMSIVPLRDSDKVVGAIAVIKTEEASPSN
jgi:PAS domain-containing protein